MSGLEKLLVQAILDLADHQCRAKKCGIQCHGFGLRNRPERCEGCPRDCVDLLWEAKDSK